MSIQTELTRLEGLRDDIGAAIRERGGTIPEGAKLADMPEGVRSIPKESLPDGDVMQFPAKLPDPHTLLLLHGEEIRDASMYGVPLTNSGVTVSSAQSKFGGKSLYFDGKARLDASSHKFKGESMNGALTVDWWEYRQNQGISVMYNRLDQSGFASLYLRFRYQDLYSSYAGGNWTAIYGNDFLASVDTLNAWHHNALVRETNGAITYYVDGKKIWGGNVLNSYSCGDGGCYIGGLPHNDGFNLIGYIDEFRISDTARWTSDFTPPTKPYDSYLT